MRSLLLVLAPVLLIAIAFPAASSAAWTPVENVHQPVIQHVGRFAVIVYSLAHKRNLTYVDVVRGETEPAGGGGANYRLVVAAAKLDASISQYQCVVWGVLGSRSDTWKLRSFRML